MAKSENVGENTNETHIYVERAHKILFWPRMKIIEGIFQDINFRTAARRSFSSGKYENRRASACTQVTCTRVFIMALTHGSIGSLHEVERGYTGARA